MKKYLLLFAIITLGLAVQSLFSQDVNMLKNASFIFKGRVISYTPFKNDNDIWMMAYCIEVKSIYKGENLKDTIILIAESVGGWSEQEDGSFIPNIQSGYTPAEKNKFALGSGTIGLFFCNQYKGSLNNLPTKIQIWNKIFSINNNSIILEPICNTRNCFFGYGNVVKEVDNKLIEYEYIKGFGKEFMRSGKINGRLVWDEETSVWEKLDNYLKEIGLTPQKDTIKKKDVNFLDKEKENELLYAKRTKNYEKLLKEYQLLQQQNLQRKKTAPNKDIEDITFTFENPIVTGSNPKFFEFDIVASGSTNNTYLDMAIFHLKYNSQVFGTHAVLNNRVHVTRGSNFNNINYTDPDTVMADKTDTFSVMISRNGDYSPLNRTLITTTPQTLLHVKMEIVNCTSTTNIEFVDVSFTGMFTTYTLTPNEPATSGGTMYDNVNYPSMLTYALCPPPVITNMFPNPITSGTNSVLTIQGSNFGNTRGTSQIWMCNDENCSFTITNFDYIDYLSWSDTEIKFRVPSRVDTLDSIYHYKGVGSGNVYVWKSDGVNAELSNPLHLEISYANMNVKYHYLTPEYKKIPVRVIPDYGDTTKYFYLDTSITNSPERELAVRAALRRWSCNTLINWAIKGNTIGQHFEDNISVIYMDDTLHGNPLAETIQTMGIVCTDDNGDTIAYFKDIDIGISRNFNDVAETWLIDTSYTQNLLPKQHDFFQVVQHELGHAHGLDHVNDNTDMMYYADKSNPINTIPYYNRVDIYNSQDAVNGGNYIFQKSQQIHSCDFVTQMVPSSVSNCSSPNNICELSNEDINLWAYPNPLNDILTVFYNLKRDAVLNITIYDYLGTKIKQVNIGKQNMGSHNIKINVNNLSSGLYFLKVKINSSVETIKLIKD